MHVRKVAIALWLVSTNAPAGDIRPVAPCDLDYPSDARVAWTCHSLRKGETLETRFPAHWRDIARFNRIDRRHAMTGTRIKVPQRLEDIAGFSPLADRLAAAESYAKFVLIDLNEQFLGAYEYGHLAFSAPVTSGSTQNADNETPTGRFVLSAAQRLRGSTLYNINGTDTPYPMTYALRFHTTRDGVIYWIHGRDVPGYPASHGCVGLYDEEMQRTYYGAPARPILDDARRLYAWVLGDRDKGRQLLQIDGPPLLIVGKAPAKRSPARPSGPSSPGDAAP